MIVAKGVGAEATDPLDVAIDARATHRALAAMIAVAATATKVAVEAGGIGEKSDTIVGVMEVATAVATAMRTLMEAGVTEIIAIGVAVDGVSLLRADPVETQTVRIIAGTASPMMKVEIIRRPRKMMIDQVKNE